MNTSRNEARRVVSECYCSSFVSRQSSVRFSQFSQFSGALYRVVWCESCTFSNVLELVRAAQWIDGVVGSCRETSALLLLGRVDFSVISLYFVTFKFPDPFLLIVGSLVLRGR